MLSAVLAACLAVSSAVSAFPASAEYARASVHDPSIVKLEEGGNLWMIYGSWFGGIYMLELDEQTGLRDYNVKYETIANVSDAYMGKRQQAEIMLPVKVLTSSI